ncbi:MAG: type II secretion system protein [Proteobacteria bacterium]|nr:MAG: type II secretion system protein [Pseudomonadota bacterium]
MRRAFTLIEILVVIAIVGLLAAILFPVFARVRENARRTSCSSNMKQIFLAHALYREDYDGIYVPCAYLNAGGGQVEWPELFLPYTRSKQIFLCPSDSVSKEISYGLSTIAFADVEFFPPSKSGVELGSVRFDLQSEFVMACESGTGDNFKTERPDAWKVVPPSTTLQFAGDSRPIGRHFGRSNVLFLDGHLKSLSLDGFYRGQNPADLFFDPDASDPSAK